MILSELKEGDKFRIDNGDETDEIFTFSHISGWYAACFYYANFISLPVGTPVIKES